MLDYIVAQGNSTKHNARKYEALSTCRRASFNLLNLGRINLASSKVAEYIVSTGDISITNLLSVVSNSVAHPFYQDMVDTVCAILEIGDHYEKL